MKPGYFLALAALAGALSAAGPSLADDGCAGKPDAGAAKLTVQNVGMHNGKGQVAVTVFPDDARRFLAHHGKLLRQRPAAVLPMTSACFWLPPGTYAVAVYHDENANQDFDRTKLGMPAEGFGFSNDAPTRFGLPSFDAVRFSLPASGRTIKVRMRYGR